MSGPMIIPPFAAKSKKNNVTPQPNPLDAEIEGGVSHLSDRTLRTARHLVTGAERALRNTQRELEEVDSWKPHGWIASWSGVTSALRKQEQAEARMIGERKKKVEELENGLRDVKARFADARRDEEKGKAFEKETLELLKAGSLTKEKFEQRVKDAQVFFNSAQIARLETIEILSKHTEWNIDNARHLQVLREVGDSLGAAHSRLQTTETVLRTARNTLVVVGATVATGGMLSGVAITWGAAGTAIAVGTAAGTTIGVTENLLEGFGHVAYGNKSVKKATQDAAVQSLHDFKSSAIAAVTTVPALKLGQCIAPVTQVVSKGRTVLAYTAAGGTLGTTSSLANSAWSLMEGEDLSTSRILGDAARDGLIGAGTGAIGGRAAFARGATPNLLNKTLIGGAEVVADFGFGMAVHELYSLGVQGRTLDDDEVINFAVPLNLSVAANYTPSSGSAPKGLKLPRAVKK